MVRDEMDVPHVGEGWVAETELYYLVKSALEADGVLHHASPRWLGQQHLDIYLPRWKVAIEYQGRQHDEPIAFFGGEEAFRRRIVDYSRYRARPLHYLLPWAQVKALFMPQLCCNRPVRFRILESS